MIIYNNASYLINIYRIQTSRKTETVLFYWVMKRDSINTSTPVRRSPKIWHTRIQVSFCKCFDAAMLNDTLFAVVWKAR